MDGSPGTQDSQRPMASGKASSRWVMQTLRQLEANQRRYALRLTATPPFDRLAEDIRFLCENTQCRRMQIASRPELSWIIIQQESRQDIGIKCDHCYVRRSCNASISSVPWLKA